MCLQKRLLGCPWCFHLLRKRHCWCPVWVVLMTAAHLKRDTNLIFRRYLVSTNLALISELKNRPENTEKISRWEDAISKKGRRKKWHLIQKSGLSLPTRNPRGSQSSLWEKQWLLGNKFPLLLPIVIQNLVLAKKAWGLSIGESPMVHWARDC